ncbi:MAG: hypothetical protein ACYSOG_05685, partial [Planctomycetota bacterium]
MMVGKMTKSLVLLVAIAGIASVAMAEEAEKAPGADYLQEEPVAHFHEVNTDFMDKFHNPMEGVTMGLDMRLREVYARNIFGVSDSFGDSPPYGPVTG